MEAFRILEATSLGIGCMLLISETNRDPVWERTTQEVHITQQGSLGATLEGENHNPTSAALFLCVAN